MASIAINGVASFEANQRFSDIENESRAMLLQPIEDFEDIPLLSLKTAVENLEDIVSKLVQYAAVAKERCIDPGNGLNRDESVSIQLYTMIWRPHFQSLHVQLNNALRAEDRTKLVPYHTYLKLLLTALSKLKSLKTTAWRGIKADLTSQYPIGKVFVWRSFSSCTESLELLQSNKFLGKTGVRTLFRIECETGKAIHGHSYYKNVSEILLLPGTQFQVLNHTNPENDLHIIHLKEIKSIVTPSSRLSSLAIKSMSRSASPSSDTDVTSSRRRKEFNSRCLSSQIVKSDAMTYTTRPYRNKILQELMNTDQKKESIRFPQQPVNMDDMKLISDELISNKWWKIIYMWKAYLEEKHLASFLCAIESNSTILCLSLDWNQLGDDGASLMADLLQSNTTLRSVYLNANRISAIGARELADMLHVNTTLTHLELTSNSIGDSGVIAIARALQENRTLQALNLSQTDMTLDGVQQLANMLELNTTLKVLRIKHNDLGDEGVMIIARALTRNSTLSTLDLSTNNVTHIGANAMAFVLQQDETALSSLIMNENPIGDIGVASIASALITNTTLTKLKLELVDMTVDGVREIVNMICGNNNIIYLALSRNLLGDDAIDLLADAFNDNQSLEHLYLNDINLTDQCVSSLVSILKQNKTLNSIELVKNQLTDEAKVTIEQAAEINQTCSLYFQFTFQGTHYI
ncbi:unnamed protein product [Rotaria sordida]|uniref:NAD(P)(+)--arginine ADP-ribosyltransferase n=1 Tax=Rotaria sordida TaxID=392033 RepID=A0A813ZEZ2_9BILA|nr:unnamed protein product [Rotaria sordida]